MKVESNFEFHVFVYSSKVCCCDAYDQCLFIFLFLCLFVYCDAYEFHVFVYSSKVCCCDAYDQCLSKAILTVAYQKIKVLLFS